MRRLLSFDAGTQRHGSRDRCFEPLLCAGARSAVDVMISGQPQRGNSQTTTSRSVRAPRKAEADVSGLVVLQLQAVTGAVGHLIAVVETDAQAAR